MNSMNDLISRQAAIDAILAVTGNTSVRELYEHVQEHGLSDMWSGGVNAAIDIIIAVPSAHPDVPDINVGDMISRKQAIDTVQRYNFSFPKYMERFVTELREGIKADLIEDLGKLPSAQPEPCDSHENDKVFVDKDAYEQCRFEYINACKITHNRTPDTRQSDINDAYAVIKALQPIFGEESF